jgi:hypothetical protein
MNYEPSQATTDIVDVFLSEHSENRIFNRLGKVPLPQGITMFYYYVSPVAEPMWAYKTEQGYIIGKFVTPTTISYKIQGIFIAQTALLHWQFKRSQFTLDAARSVNVRRINSQIQNKLKGGIECKKESVDASMVVSSTV